MAELYIEGNAIDLKGDDSIIAMTYQGNEIGKLQSRQGHFSNTFFAPYTINNARILENADQAQSATNKPYELLQCNVVIDGLDVANGGKVQINSTSSGYNLNVYSGNKPLFDELKSKSIRDLDLSEYDHRWTIEHILEEGAFRTEGYVYPLLNYGPLSRPSVTEVDVQYLHNCFYLHTLVEKIFEASSFSFTTTLTENPFYKSIVIPVVDSNLQASRAAAENQFKTEYSTSIPLRGNDHPSGSPFIFDSVIIDPQSGYNATTGEFTLPNGFEGVIGVSMDIRPLFVDSNSFFSFKILRNGQKAAEEIVTQERVVNLATPVTVFDTGDVMQVVWENQQQGDLLIVKSGSSFYTDPNADLVYRGTVNCEEILPDMSQADLLKTVLQLFGAFIDTKRKKVRIVTLNEIVANKNQAPDWSEKVAMKGSQQRWYISKRTRISGYAKRNYMRYADDSLVTNNLGDGYFDVNDETIGGTRTLLTLPFAPSDGKDIFANHSVAIVPKFTEYDETEQVFIEEGKPKPRILFVSPEGIRPTYTDGNISDQPGLDFLVAYFISRNKAHNLGFGDSVIADWYNSLVDLLDKAQRYSFWCKLNPSDIQDLDFFTPIYLEQASAYFILTKISDYIEGELTRVEIIKL